MSQSGDELRKSATKKAKGIGPKKSKYEKAVNLYIAAGKAYEAEKNPVSSGESYAEASKLQEALENYSEAGKLAFEAGKSFSQSPIAHDLAFENFKRASRFLIISGKSVQAADIYVQASKLFHKSSDFSLEIDCLQLASQLFSENDKQASSTQYLSLAAEAMVENNQLFEASDLFASLGRRPGLNGLKQNIYATDFYTKAILCKIAIGDINAAESLYNEYVEELPGFTSLNEGIVIQALISNIKAGDYDAASRAITHFLQRHQQNLFYPRVFGIIRDSFENEEDIC